MPEEMNLLPAKILNVKKAFHVIATSTLLFALLVAVIVDCHERSEHQQDTWHEEIQDPGIAITKLNSTAVKVSCEICANVEMLKGFVIKILYQLLLADVLHFDKVISCEGKIHLTSDSMVDDIERCKGMLNLFGTYNDTINKDYAYLYEYCKPHEVTLTSTGRDDYMVIGDLLPHLPYKWNYTIEYHGEKIPHLGEEKFLTIVCMNDSAPLYAPQTDIGGFKIDTKIDEKAKTNGQNLGEFRSVELYWRPVPHILAGCERLSYEISCSSEDDKRIVYNTTITDKRVGLVDLSSQRILSNSSYLCQLRSGNYLGQSEVSSLIYIPKQSSIINLHAEFNFYAAGVTNTEYLLKWTDIEKLLPDREYAKGSNKTTQTNYYTIYWCLLTSQTRGCSSIEGMMKTTNTTAAIVIPGDHTPQNRIFGISYRTRDNFTGIIWSDCVASVRSQAQSVYDPLEIYKAFGNPDNPDVIHINWVVKGCKSIQAINDRYEFNYCQLGPIDPCDPPMGASMSKADENHEYDFENNPNCSTLFVPNNLLSETTLKNLSPSTSYAIRVRQIVDNEPSNSWSKTTFAQTFPDPSKTKDCFIRQRPTLFIISICFITLVTFTLIYNPAIKLIRHYWKLIFQYVQNKKGVEQQLEGMLENRDSCSDMDLKFWLNRFPDPTGNSSNSHSSLKFCEAENTEEGLNGGTKFDKRNSDGEEYVQLQPSLPDYISYHLGVGRSLDSLSERDDVRDPLSDTEDISVTSNSSFLDNVLNADTDSNNIS